jgi:hypothetical protein
MKLLSVLAVLFLSFSAFSYDVHKCTVTARTKRVFIHPVEISRTWYLASGYQNLFNGLKILNTNLSLKLSQGNLDGSVNGQYMFIVEGGVSDGRFESATEEGTIVCEDAVATEALIKFKPWDEWKPVAEMTNLEREIYNSCYHGRSQVVVDKLRQLIAARDLTSSSSLRLDNEGTIVFTRTESVCVEGRGGSDPHDFECTRRRPKQREYKIPDCAGWVDPRSVESR